MNVFIVTPTFYISCMELLFVVGKIIRLPGSNAVNDVVGH